MEPRFLCLRLLEGDAAFLDRADAFLEGALSRDGVLLRAAEEERQELKARGIGRGGYEDLLAGRATGAGTGRSTGWSPGGASAIR